MFSCSTKNICPWLFCYKILSLPTRPTARCRQWFFQNSSNVHIGKLLYTKIFYCYVPTLQYQFVFCYFVRTNITKNKILFWNNKICYLFILIDQKQMICLFWSIKNKILKQILLFLLFWSEITKITNFDHLILLIKICYFDHQNNKFCSFVLLFLNKITNFDHQNLFCYFDRSKFDGGITLMPPWRK